MKEMFIMAGTAIFSLIVWSTVWNIATTRKLNKHQIEWNTIKQKAKDSTELFDLYVSYTSQLFAKERNTWLGCCFPDMGRFNDEWH